MVQWRVPGLTLHLKNVRPHNRKNRTEQHRATEQLERTSSYRHPFIWRVVPAYRRKMLPYAGCISPVFCRNLFPHGRIDRTKAKRVCIILPVRPARPVPVLLPHVLLSGTDTAVCATRCPPAAVPRQQVTARQNQLLMSSSVRTPASAAPPVC